MKKKRNRKYLYLSGISLLGELVLPVMFKWMSIQADMYGLEHPNSNFPWKELAENLHINYVVTSAVLLIVTVLCFVIGLIPEEDVNVPDR